MSDPLRRDLEEIDLTLEEVPVRNLETDEVSTAWELSSPSFEGVYRGQNPAHALRLYAQSFE